MLLIILVPRAYDLLVSSWIVGPGNSCHLVAHAQCNKLPLRLLSVRKPETFCRRIVKATKEDCNSVLMANLEEILTTLPAASLKNHILCLRLTAFRPYFKIIQQLFL